MGRLFIGIQHITKDKAIAEVENGSELGKELVDLMMNGYARIYKSLLPHDKEKYPLMETLRSALWISPALVARRKLVTVYNNLSFTVYVHAYFVFRFECRAAHRGGQLGHFAPGPSLKGAPGGPMKGPLNTCLKDRYTLIEQSDLNTLIEQSQYSSEEQCTKLIDKEIWLVMGSYCHCQQVVTFFFFFFLVFTLQLGSRAPL